MARASSITRRTIGVIGTAAFGLAAMALARAVHRRHSLKGRVAIVTGGSRGLGLRIAEELGRQGMRVAICGRDPRALAEAERRLTAQGVSVIAERADLGDRAQAEAFVKRAASEWGRLDVLVNNAGVIHVEPAQSAPEESIEDAMRSNFWSAVHMTYAALPYLRAQGSLARVANIVSIGGRVAVPHLLGYSASKFALMGFSEGLAAELRSSGIRVVTVIPSLMRTGSFYNAEFGGNTEAELGWFRASASLPLLSVHAKRAAERVVRAIVRGETIAHVGLPAAILARVHGLAPGLTVRAMAIASRLLPSAPAQPSAPRRGREVPRPRRFTTLGERDARENNEAPPPA